MILLADVIVKLAQDGTVESIDWYHEQTRREWLAGGKDEGGEIFTTLGADQVGELCWNNEIYCYQRIDLGTNGRGIILKKKDTTMELFRKSLNYLDDGIQIYDKNATLVYINEISCKLSGFDKSCYPVEGQHLLDLYQVNDTSSTVLTALRTKQPIINRFASFQSMDGKTLITNNTGYPVYTQAGDFLGVVAFETDVNVLRKKKERLDKISGAMEAQIATGLYAKPMSKYTFDDYIGANLKVREIVSLARSVAAKESNVLLLGETGTGKEIFAQSIHRASLRWQKKFVAINCAAVPEQLVESILFGTEKGSFTGSIEKSGLFEEGNGGTIYLDELNSMGLAMQSKLLRVLQENVFRRVGGQQEIPTNVRIIASCNENVFGLIQENKLRRDLFYRVATIMIDLPPLRERLDDLEALIWHRIHQSAAKYALPFTKVDPEVLWLLQQYSWPGNVRELNHVLDYALTVADDEVMLVEHLPSYVVEAVQGIQPKQSPSGPSEPLLVGSVDATLQGLLEEYEERVIQQALSQTGGNISKAAQLLGVKRQSLQYRLRKSR